VIEELHEPHRQVLLVRHSAEVVPLVRVRQSPLPVCTPYDQPQFMAKSLARSTTPAPMPTAANIFDVAPTWAAPKALIR